MAKDAGRNRIHVYNEDSFEVAQRHREMQQIVDINQAFDENRFVLYQQPIQSLGAARPEDGYFCEVLVRMVDESGFPVLPGNFLPTRYLGCKRNPGLDVVCNGCALHHKPFRHVDRE